MCLRLHEELKNIMLLHVKSVGMDTRRFDYSVKSQRKISLNFKNSIEKVKWQRKRWNCIHAYSFTYPIRTTRNEMFRPSILFRKLTAMFSPQTAGAGSGLSASINAN